MTLILTSDPWNFLPGRRDWRTGQHLAESELKTSRQSLPPSMHYLVIMNPPFTRDSLRYDQFGVADELAVKGRETDANKGQSQ